MAAIAAGAAACVAPVVACRKQIPIYIIDWQHDFLPVDGELHVGVGKSSDEAKRFAKWLEDHKYHIRPIRRLDDDIRLADLGRSVHWDDHQIRGIFG